MEVSIICRETIKPSSPTPPHLRTFKVSLLDKVFKSLYVPFITYYSIKHPDEVEHERIKVALAQTLTRFYPLAGRHADENTIDCNDNGALFVTAHVKCRLDEFLKDLKVEESHKLTTSWPSTCPGEDEPAQMCIQLNVFECGGIALSLSISHFTCDAVSASAFMKCWSEISRIGSQDFDQVECPFFPGAEIFPNDDNDDVIKPWYVLERPFLAGEGKCLVRRFVFEKDSICALREKAKSEGASNPTRVEVVSMFAWKKCMDSSAKVWGVRKPSIVSTHADLRRRMVPQWSQYSCGNIVLKVTIQSSNTSVDGDDIGGLVKSFRTSMQEDVHMVIPNLMKKSKGGGRATLFENIDRFNEICKDTNLNPYNLTSWCKLGFTDIDFGWGKPVWFGLLGMEDLPHEFRNYMMITDGEAGENIDLWVYLDAREMNELENDQEFLAYASPNPPKLI